MKKVFEILFFGVFIIVITLSMAACNADNTRGKSDDLQTQLTQQKEKLDSQAEELKQLSASLKELAEQNRELENEIALLKEKNRILEETINEITNSIPHEVGIVGYSNSDFFHTLPEQYKVLKSKAELTSYLSELDDHYEQYKANFPFPLTGKWGAKSQGKRVESGQNFSGDDIAEAYNETFFNSKALIFCYFLSPNLFIKLIGTNLYLDGTTLTIKINYSMSEATAIDYVMVVLEVDNSFVDNITEVTLKVNSL